MDQEMTCAWGPAPTHAACGRPAKGSTDDPTTGNGLVCGVHDRSARSRGYEVTDFPGPDVRVGQVWRDNDGRIARGELPGRQVRVIEVDATHATVMVCSAVSRTWGQERRSRIRLDRFRPASTGYRLVDDAPAEG